MPQVRWTEQSQMFKAETDRLVGDVVLLTGFLSYTGPFNQEFRTLLNTTWYNQLVSRSIPVTPNLNLTENLVDTPTIGEWNLQVHRIVQLFKLKINVFHVSTGFLLVLWVFFADVVFVFSLIYFYSRATDVYFFYSLSYRGMIGSSLELFLHIRPRPSWATRVTDTNTHGR